MKKVFITVFMVLAVVALTHCGYDTRPDQQQAAANSTNPTGTVTNVYQAP